MNGVHAVDGYRWNSNFQQLLNMEDTESKFHKLAFLAHDTHILLFDRFIRRGRLTYVSFSD